MMNGYLKINFETELFYLLSNNFSEDSLHSVYSIGEEIDKNCVQTQQSTASPDVSSTDEADIM